MKAQETKEREPTLDKFLALDFVKDKKKKYGYNKDGELQYVVVFYKDIPLIISLAPDLSYEDTAELYYNIDVIVPKGNHHYELTVFGTFFNDAKPFDIAYEFAYSHLDVWFEISKEMVKDMIDLLLEDYCEYLQQWAKDAEITIIQRGVLKK